MGSASAGGAGVTSVRFSGAAVSAASFSLVIFGSRDVLGGNSNTAHPPDVRLAGHAVCIAAEMGRRVGNALSRPAPIFTGIWQVSASVPGETEKGGGHPVDG